MKDNDCSNITSSVSAKYICMIVVTKGKGSYSIVDCVWKYKSRHKNILKTLEVLGMNTNIGKIQITHLIGMSGI